MGRAASKFRQRDVARAVKAAKAAGESIERIEISPNGTIAIFPEKVERPSKDMAEVNEWDE